MDIDLETVENAISIFIKILKEGVGEKDRWARYLNVPIAVVDDWIDGKSKPAFYQSEQILQQGTRLLMEIKKKWRDFHEEAFSIFMDLASQKLGHGRFIYDGEMSAISNQPSKQYVYFISNGTEIKIGISEDPHKRLRALQVGNTLHLELLHFIEGNNKKEKEFHEKFSTHRVSGEWFRIVPELISFIEELKLSGELGDD